MKKLSSKQLAEVHKLSTTMQCLCPKWRSGQAYFNALCALHPDIGDEIRDSDIDPYYVDKNVRKCIKALTEE